MGINAQGQYIHQWIHNHSTDTVVRSKSGNLRRWQAAIEKVLDLRTLDPNTINLTRNRDLCHNFRNVTVKSHGCLGILHVRSRRLQSQSDHPWALGRLSDSIRLRTIIISLRDHNLGRLGPREACHSKPDTESPLHRMRDPSSIAL